MKDELNNIEQELKGVAQGISFDLDTADIWANIEPELPPVDRKRKPIWWMTASILLGLLIIGAVVISKTLVSDSDIEKGNKVVTLEQPKSNINRNVTSEVTQSKNGKSETETQRESTNSSTLSSQNQIESNNDSAIVPSTDDLSKKPINTPAAKTTNSTTNSTNNSTIAINPATSIPTTIYNDGHRYLEENSGNDIGESNLPTHSIILTPIRQEPLISIDEREELASLSILATRSEYPIDYTEHLEMNMPFIDPVNVTKWSPIIMFQTGISRPSYSITGANGEGLDLTQFSNEKPLLGLTTGLSYGKENNQGWRWSLGLEYSSLISRYTKSDQLIEMDVINTDESFTIDKNGNTIGNEGTLDVTTVTNYDIVWHRNNEYVNIQLGIGKEIARINNWAVSADLFGGYNVWSRHDGYYFQEGAESITKFRNGENNPYTNQGINTGARISLTYQLNNISIGLSPFANMNLQSTTRATNYYQTKNSHYGIQLGVVYRP